MENLSVSVQRSAQAVLSRSATNKPGCPHTPLGRTLFLLRGRTTEPLGRGRSQSRRRCREEASFVPQDGDGYLASLLTALRLPMESQLLVFSETSAQAKLITPSAPRAIYSHDTTALGFVKGISTLEIAAHDPKQARA